MVAGNGGGITLLAGTQFANVHDNSVVGSAGEGLRIQASHSNIVERNLISGTSDLAIILEGANDNIVRANEVVGAADASVVVSLGSTRNRLEANILTEGEAGIIVEGSNANELIGNIAHAMGDNGITLENAHGNLIRGNDVRFNSGGIEVDQSSNNRIESNNASETDGYGIEVGDFSLSNVIVSNTANSNASEGISIGASAPPGSGNLIDRNTAHGNGGDGINVGGTGHIIVGNRANSNVKYGISAADATLEGMNIDGGGNTATGNLGGSIDPFTLQVLQCYNIVCDGSTPPPADQVPPNTFVTAGPVSPTLQTTATFRFTGTDNATAVTFECRIDAAAFAPCTTPATYTGLALGAHTFEVRAVDFLGNKDQSPAVHTWTIEAPAPGVAPDTIIDSGPDPTTVATSATFTFSSDEPGVTFQCKLDAGAFTACTSPASFTGLGVGGHTLAVRAIDTESLVDASPATFSWTVSAPPVSRVVSCGQVLTQSTLVTNDLLGCSGNGLVIGAHGITVDLNGHTIEGIGQGAGIINNGFDGVTITNGVVQEFDYGVLFNAGTSMSIVSGMTLQFHQNAAISLVNADNGVSGNVIRNNTLFENEFGILVSAGTSATVIRLNTITGSSRDAVRIEASNGNRIEDNLISEPSGAGVALAGSDGNTVIGNTITMSSSAGIAVGEPGLPSDDNRIEENSINDSGSAGISIIGSTGNELFANIVQLAGSAGIDLEQAQDNLIQGNDVRFNSTGIELTQSNDNRIEGNNASASGGTGIRLEGGSLSNVVVLNNASGNSGEGIAVNDSASSANGNVIDRNVANGNSVGIIVGSSVHRIVGNEVNFNDGWGILASSGNIDGGANTASGNAEPGQCSGVVCTIGLAPGAPDTTIVDKPAPVTSSQYALFTFIGTDDTTPLSGLEFECRLDSTSDLDWVECENPQEYFGVAPGTHTFEVRALDQNEQPDPTPASYTWTYSALPTGVAPNTFIDLAPPLASPVLEGFFTFSSDEPDVTFECSLDLGAFAPCEFVYEFAFEEFEVGQHTFRVRATDFEGNTDPTPATYTWVVTGIVTTVTGGPAYEPSGEPGEPANGGETTDTTAVITFEANVADATFICSIDLGPFTACTSPVTYTGLAVGEHLFQVLATDPETEAEQIEVTEYEWTVISGDDTVPPTTLITSAPADNSSSTVFTFVGADDQTQPLALAFECRLDSTLEADFSDCVSPFNLLDEFPEFAPGEHTFEVRAVDNAEPDGNVDPTPASHSWTSVADTVPPQTAMLTGPVTPTIEPDVEFTFSGTDNATPELLVVFECSVDGGVFEPCDSPESVQGIDPGVHTFEVRAVDLAGNVDPTPASFTWTVVGPPVTSFVSGPAPASTASAATFVFTSDQPGSTFECSLDGNSFVPLHVARSSSSG